MRTCKDLGIASELWDPSWVRVFKEEECERLDVQHVKTKQFSKVWRKKGTELPYPWEEIRQSSGTASRGYFKR